MNVTKISLGPAACLLLALLAGGCLPGGGEEPRSRATDGGIKEIAVVISPSLPATNWAGVKSALNEFVLESAPGTRFRFLDGKNLVSLGRELTVPTLKYTSRNAVMQRVGHPLQAIWREAEEARQSAGAADGAVDIPRALDHLVTLSSERPMAVLVLGSMIYDSTNAPGFSMATGAVPNDVTVATNLAASPFGTAGRERHLTNVWVHFCYPSESWGHHFFRQAVVDFWSKWTRAQSGVLASASADLVGTLDKLAKPGLPRLFPDSRLDLTGGEMRMCPVENRVLPRWMPRSVAEAERMAADSPATPIPEMAGRAGVGILWEPRVDVDLYVWVKGAAEPVYFGNKTSANLAYGHDYTTGTRSYQAGGAEADAEYITVTNVTSLADLEVYVNYYNGTVAPLAGKVVLCWGGRTRIGDFSIQAERGNQGADRQNRRQSPFWTRIDLAHLASAQLSAR